MTRAERRRAEKAQQKDPVYLVSNSDLQRQIELRSEEYVKQRMKEVKREIQIDTMNDALTLMLALPMKVLQEKYWKKSFKREIPKFTDEVLKLYADVYNEDRADISQLEAELWINTGFKLQNGKDDPTIEKIQVDAGEYSFTAEHDVIHGKDRYIAVLDEPDGKEIVFYGWSVGELRDKVLSKVKEWEKILEDRD